MGVIMSAQRRSRILNLLAIGSIVFLAASTSYAATGTNSVLDANAGQFYIPISPGASGQYGTGSAGHRVGLDDSWCTLSSTNRDSQGNVWFILSFDIASLLPPNTRVPYTAGPMVMTLPDIDFKTQLIGTACQYYETLELRYMTSASDNPDLVAADKRLFLDVANYGKYRADGFGATNNVTVNYDIPWKTTATLPGFGFSDADFDTMTANKSFAVYAKFTGVAHYIGSGSTNYHLRIDSTKDFQFNFTGEPIPEPATMSVLALGAAILGSRARRNSAR
jgi:hypothetical protein